MTPAKTTTDEDVALPVITGPALLYTSTLGGDGTQNFQRIDLDSPGDPRERAICRALLHHALALLDATEPTRRAPVTGMEARRP